MLHRLRRRGGASVAAGCRVDVHPGGAVIPAARDLTMGLRLAAYQAVIAVAAAGVWFAIGGTGAATGALLGGGFGAFLSAYVAIRVFSVRAEDDPEGFLRRFYRAEGVKLLLAIVFFAMVARYYEARMLEVITGFIATLPVYWFALARAR